MLRKDDLFKVVFNPGTDEVEKQGLGPAPATCRDTGLASRTLAGNAAQPRRNYTAKLHHSIGGVEPRQFLRVFIFASTPAADVGAIHVGTDAPARAGRAKLSRIPGSIHQCIPIRKGLRRRHANLWGGHHAWSRRQIWQRIHFLSPSYSQHRPANKK